MLTVRLTKTLRDLYASDFLLTTLPRAAQSGDTDALARLHCDSFKALYNQRAQPSLLITILDKPSTNHHGRPIAVAGNNTDPSVWSLYTEHASLDHTSVHNALRGVVVSTLDFGSLDDFRDTPIYQKFSAPAGRLHSFAVTYALPNRTDRAIRLNYDSGPGTGFPQTLGRDDVEFFTLPFALAWLHAFDVIDAQTLRAWLTPLIGMTPNRLAVLRELVCGTRYSHTRAAERLGVKPRTLHNHYAAIHRAVFFDTANKDGNASQMTDLMRVFHFLTFMGKAHLAQDIQALQDKGIFARQPILQPG